MKYFMALALSTISLNAFPTPNKTLCQVRAENAALDAFLLVRPTSDSLDWGAGIADAKLASDSDIGANFEIKIKGSRTDAGVTTTVYHLYAVATIKDSTGNCLAMQV